MSKQPAGSLPRVPIKTSFVHFQGGLDTETPQLNVPPGWLRASQNFEHAITGGYSTIIGYERYDGRTSPSSLTYSILDVTITGSINVGDTLLGATSGATGTVIAVTATTVVLAGVTGGNYGTENVKVSGVVQGSCVGPQAIGGLTTPLLAAQYKDKAAGVQRALIQTVPGSGSILGVWRYKDTTFAFRNNAGGTATAMYKSTIGGWALVDLGREVAFTSGSGIAGAVIPEGTTITGHTSNATAIMTRVIVTSGTWAGGDAAGRLVLASQVGSFQSENLDIGLSLDVATIAGNSSAITFAVPGGSFEFVNANFGGGLSTQRMYGCDGKNRGFEFDGSVMVFINTGMTLDAPSHLCAHKWHLFFSFYGSVQHSSPGDPYEWSPILGASEIGIGDTVTGFVSQPGSQTSATLAIFARNEIDVLYGTSSADWNMTTYKTEAGAIAGTMHMIGPTVMLDDRGIGTLSTTVNFGNFDNATISQKVQSWVNEHRPFVTASCINRDKNQYRIFFSDGSGLYMSFVRGTVTYIGVSSNDPAYMPTKFPNPVACICSVEDSNGKEVTFFGSTNGYVYQLDRGTSFDGQVIDCLLDASFDNLKSPTVMKKFRRLVLEVLGTGYSELYVGYSLEYLDSNTAQPSDENQTLSLAQPTWDSGLLWDSGITWDGRNIIPIPVDMTGSATNISIELRSSSTYFDPVKVSGALIQYSPFRVLR